MGSRGRISEFGAVPFQDPTVLLEQNLSFHKILSISVFTDAGLKDQDPQALRWVAKCGTLNS